GPPRPAPLVLAQHRLPPPQVGRGPVVQRDSSLRIAAVHRRGEGLDELAVLLPAFAEGLFQTRAVAALPLHRSGLAACGRARRCNAALAIPGPSGRGGHGWIGPGLRPALAVSQGVWCWWTQRSGQDPLRHSILPLLPRAAAQGRPRARSCDRTRM